MIRTVKILGVGVLCAWLAACTTPAPPYAASVSNVEVTAKLGSAISVGKFEFDKGKESELNEVGARASNFPSPVNGSYADYFADAAMKELRAAGKFDAASPKALTGTLIKNHLSAAGLNTNDAALQVRFKLAEGTKVTYDKLVSAEHQWESAFLGAIAIPRALDQYIATIQKLMRSLFSDPDFVRATGK
ncbi:MAG: hypothetical protein JNM79_04180 [Burkholderiales bacterium]|nr:hypothetical protein [Burkholderiales bacterium]